MRARLAAETDGSCLRRRWLLERTGRERLELGTISPLCGFFLRSTRLSE